MCGLCLGSVLLVCVFLCGYHTVLITLTLGYVLKSGVECFRFVLFIKDQNCFVHFSHLWLPMSLIVVCNVCEDCHWYFRDLASF